MNDSDSDSEGEIILRKKEMQVAEETKVKKVDQFLLRNQFIIFQKEKITIYTEEDKHLQGELERKYLRNLNLSEEKYQHMEQRFLSSEF